MSMLNYITTDPRPVEWRVNQPLMLPKLFSMLIDMLCVGGLLFNGACRLTQTFCLRLSGDKKCNRFSKNAFSKHP